MTFLKKHISGWGYEWCYLSREGDPEDNVVAVVCLTNGVPQYVRMSEDIQLSVAEVSELQKVMETTVAHGSFY